MYELRQTGRDFELSARQFTVLRSISHSAPLFYVTSNDYVNAPIFRHFNSLYLR
jgi:hypothetical protein